MPVKEGLSESVFQSRGLFRLLFPIGCKVKKLDYAFLGLPVWSDPKVQTVEPFHGR